jgi:hypothetical protein
MGKTNRPKGQKDMKDRLKNSLIEQLKQTPIVQIACKKICISRASYYRWRKNKEFAKKADIALAEGLTLINDMAESQLLSAIQEKNMTGITFWLKHRHPAYGNRLEISGHLKHIQEDLTKEEKALVRKALKLALPQNKHE